MKENPTGVILASIIITAAILTVRGLTKGEIRPAAYAGLAIVAFFLLAIAQFSPELASAFALLVLVAVLLSGTSDINGVLAIVQKKGK
jgi:uncharacterized membrane protein